MSKSVTDYVCTDCGWSGLKWYGRCPNCGEWGTIKEFRQSRRAGMRAPSHSTSSPVAVVSSTAPSTTISPHATNEYLINKSVITPTNNALQNSTSQNSTSENNTSENSTLQDSLPKNNISKNNISQSDISQSDTSENNISQNSLPTTNTASGTHIAHNALNPIGDIAHEESFLDSDNDENYEEERFSTGFSEFDRVLGGGIVPGSVTLIAGSPGIGKSTLLLASASKVARLNKQVLYISGEESTRQIRMRARRIGALDPHLSLASTTELESAIELIEQYRPQLVILDSVQTITTDTNSGMLGGASQVREVARIVVNTAKQLNIPIFLIGHVTKDGTVAGPRTLEHLVDVVCQFEGDPQIALRMIRAQKNRFGPTDEVGCFDMTDEGLEEVTDPSGLFISQSDMPSEGTCITFTMDGHRSMPIEIQALTTETALPAPRRAVNGVDFNRISMLIAVLYKHGGINLLNKDIYISTIAGAQAKEPACDLAICAALSSAATGLSINRTTSALGEVSLTGEVRPIPRIAQRLAEAQRMGFTKILIPAHQNIHKIERFKDIDLIRVATVRSALKELGITRERSQTRREEF